ncbi:MAG TPA: hypothetical protein VHF27_04895 [Acidimicrobiales bacterium]|nr:hypothetical protein [Acidimicrobiales bacterium]
MNDDRVSWASDREIFEAIVSQLEDPDVARLRRAFRVLAALFFLLGALAVVVAGLGWPGLAGFSSTFGASAAIARRRVRRRHAPG